MITYIKVYKKAYANREIPKNKILCDMSCLQYFHNELNIEKLNKIEHRHSIVVIKDTFNEFPNRYLVYDDLKWECKFFINYKTHLNDNENFIKKHLSADLKVPAESISLSYVTEQTHEKFSERDNRSKTYAHTFYLAKIDNIPEYIRKDLFEIDSKKYYWKNITELETDEDVIEKNMDILGVVKSSL